MKHLYLLIILEIVVFCSIVQSQTWVQTGNTPSGGGITDLLVRSNGDLIAGVGSFNWPNTAGGIRKSTDDGQSWQNVSSAYICRTIEEAFNGYLYASIWYYPQNEGLYRSTDGGDVWQGPSYSVPSGNNIFSIAVKEGTPDYFVFLGTREGILRSTNSGSTFQSSSNGLPQNSWVRDIEIDSSGLIAAATTNGLFISTNNGDSWLATNGIPASDTTVFLAFDYPINAGKVDDVRLNVGTQNGNLYESFSNSQYLTLTLLAVFEGEISGMAVWALKNLNEKRHGVTTFSDGFYSTSDPLAGFNKENNGLPENPKLSALTGRVVSPRTVDERVDMYAGVYENMVGGAKIYKKSYIPTDVEDDNLTIREYRLYQNYPNPFNPATNIRYAIGNKQFVTLKVYDVLGNEVATLIDEYKPAGNYEVEFRSESGINQLVSGIYFYQLRTFDPLTNSGRVYVETKKMVLLK
ncbi:MAG: hypothetical protein BroJett005_13310 [Ignavibacteriota bacterium]|nr:MAG: hypothetical protein BroJett005_13310 [Ignavibacteriota bacterium]